MHRTPSPLPASPAVQDGAGSPPWPATTSSGAPSWLCNAGALWFGSPCVQPRQGDALVFFPAFADGRFDDRMAHAGMPVQYGEGGWRGRVFTAV